MSFQFFLSLFSKPWSSGITTETLNQSVDFSEILSLFLTHRNQIEALLVIAHSPFFSISLSPDPTFFQSIVATPRLVSSEEKRGGDQTEDSPITATGQESVKQASKQAFSTSFHLTSSYHEFSTLLS